MFHIRLSLKIYIVVIHILVRNFVEHVFSNKWNIYSLLWCIVRRQAWTPAVFVGVYRGMRSQRLKIWATLRKVAVFAKQEKSHKGRRLKELAWMNLKPQWSIRMFKITNGVELKDCKLYYTYSLANQSWIMRKYGQQQDERNMHNLHNNKP